MALYSAGHFAQDTWDRCDLERISKGGRSLALTGLATAIRVTHPQSSVLEKGPIPIGPSGSPFRSLF